VRAHKVLTQKAIRSYALLAVVNRFSASPLKNDEAFQERLDQEIDSFLREFLSRLQALRSSFEERFFAWSKLDYLELPYESYDDPLEEVLVDVFSHYACNLRDVDVSSKSLSIAFSRHWNFLPKCASASWLKKAASSEALALEL
jgi:hypothetical protein